MFQAVALGYIERLQDQQDLAVMTGYWSGYYANSQKPKPVAQVLEMMAKARKGDSGTRAPDVDVAAFLERERRFKERQAQIGGDPVGQ